MVTVDNHPFTYFDIGAGTRSLEAGLLNVHNNRPTISIADKMRSDKAFKLLMNIPEEFRTQYVKKCCQCVFGLEACPHAKDFTGLLSVDSSYYNNVFAGMCRWLGKNPEQHAYAIFHVFNPDVREAQLDIAGTIEGEWTSNYVGGKKIITMNVIGNPYAYQHPVHELNDRLYFSNITEFKIPKTTNDAHDYGKIVASVIRRANMGNSAYLLVRLDTKQDLVIDSNNEAFFDFDDSVSSSRAVKIHQGYNLDALKNGHYISIRNESEKKLIVYRVVNDIIQGGVIKGQTDFKPTDLMFEYNINDIKFNDLMNIADINRTTAFMLSKKSQIGHDLLSDLFAKKLVVFDADVTHLTCLIRESIKDFVRVQESIVSLLSDNTTKYANDLQKNKYHEFLDPYERFRAVLYLIFSVFVKISIVTTAFYAIGQFLRFATTKHTVLAKQDSIHVNNNNPTNELMFSFITAILTLGVSCLLKKKEIIINYIVDNLPTIEYKNTYEKLSTIAQNFFLKSVKLIKTTCVTDDNYEEVSGALSDQVKWNLCLPALLKKKHFLSLACDCQKLGLKQVGQVFDQSPQPIIYHICKINNYCAVKRQATEVTRPHPQMLKIFDRWFKNLFERELIPILKNFSYNYQDWYNHLSTGQQKEIDLVDKQNVKLNNTYTMFVKVEKQLYENKKAPKNRCICSPTADLKYVLGPVCFALESYMTKYLKGYCGGKNWGQLETFYNEQHMRGNIKTVQLDGSGFDRTQAYEIKKIIDHRIYSYIKNKVTHVTQDIFSFYAFPEWRKIEVSYFEKNKIVHMGNIKVRGTTFSGSPDTTLMNTIKMIMYNRFVLEYFLDLTTAQYGILCKGDDATIFLPYKISNSQIEKAYYTVFSNKKTGVHGLGQIAKYLKIGEITDVDFCSTSTVYCSESQNYKIIRKLDRFLSLTPWSRKALHYSNNDLKIYLQSLYEGNLAWIGNMPIYRAYNQLLKQDMTDVVVKLKTGEKKKYLEVEAKDDIETSLYLDKDYIYSNESRHSGYQITEQEGMDWLYQKFNYSQQEVYLIEEAILRVS